MDSDSASGFGFGKVDSAKAKWIRVRVQLEVPGTGSHVQILFLERHEILEHVWCYSSVTKCPFHYFSFDLET